MMVTREEKRQAMLEKFLALPEWLRQPFEPMRPGISLLMDRGHDREAADMVAAVQVPSGFTVEQSTAFLQARAEIGAGIESLIPPNPLDTDEARAVLAQSELTREESR